MREYRAGPVEERRLMPWAQDISIGDAVSHPSYGDGLISAIAGTEITIAFASGARPVDATRAHLKRRK
jgi:hypothetical protein